MKESPFELVTEPVYGCKPDAAVEFLRQFFPIDEGYEILEAYATDGVRFYVNGDLDAFDEEDLDDLETLSQDEGEFVGACLNKLAADGVIPNGIYIIDELW